MACGTGNWGAGSKRARVFRSVIDPSSAETISGRTPSDVPLPVGFEDQIFGTLLSAQTGLAIPTTFTWTSETPAIASIDRLKEIGCSDIRCLSILTSHQGKEMLMQHHPDVKLFAVSTDDDLTEDGYITPGIGDVGSRYYNTV